MNRRAMLGAALAVPVQSMVGKSSKVWHAPSYVRHLGTRAMSLNIYDPPYGARGDGVVDNGRAILRALADAAGPAAHGHPTNVDQPPGLWMTSRPILVPNQVNYRGSGFGSTLRALPSFPANTALMRLGLGDTAAGNNGTRVESIVLDCATIPGSIGLYSTQLNEVTGIRDFVIINHMHYGVHFEQTGLGVYNFRIEDGAIICNAMATATEGIRLENSIGGVSMEGKVSRVSIVPAAGAVQQAHGIRLLGRNVGGTFVQGKIDDIHVENTATGVFFDVTSFGHVVGIEGETNVDDLVRINNPSVWRFNPPLSVVVMNAFNNGGGQAVNDLLNGYASGPGPGAMVPFYSTRGP